MVSTASTTGAKEQFGAENTQYFERIASMGLRNQCLVGFGISNRATLEAAQRHAAGAIVGSKFVSLLGESQSVDVAVKKLLDALG